MAIVVQSNTVRGHSGGYQMALTFCCSASEAQLSKVRTLSVSLHCVLAQYLIAQQWPLRRNGHGCAIEYVRGHSGG